MILPTFGGSGKGYNASLVRYLSDRYYEGELPEVSG